MNLLDEINSTVAANAAEAEHQAVLDGLKKKYKSLSLMEAAGKTVARVVARYNEIAIIFQDNTFLNLMPDEEFGGHLSMNPGIEWVATQGLMSAEDRAAMNRSTKFFEDKRLEADNLRLLHQVKARFGREKLRELFAEEV